MKASTLASIAVVSLAISTGMAGPAAAQEAPNLWNAIFGGGTPPPEINYSERAPLVIPKQKTLITPGSPEAALEDPNWPKDPDEKRKRARAADQLAANQRGGADGTILDPANTSTNAPIILTEPNPNRAVGDNPSIFEPNGQFRNGSPSGGDVQLQAGVEPKRRSLIEPPPGMRLPSDAAPLDGSGELPSEAAKDNTRNWWLFRNTPN